MASYIIWACGLQPQGLHEDSVLEKPSVPGSGQVNKNETSVYRQSFAVEYRYPVHFVRDVFAPRSSVLLETLGQESPRKRNRLFVCIDSGVAASHPTLTRRIKDYCHQHHERLELVATEVVPGGEEVKGDWELVKDLMIALGNHHLDRHSYVCAIGGGSVLDMVGFVAALVHRGLRLIRMPTTVLAQNDAGVGVKNGMNEHGKKNFIGTFAPPYAVINDFSFLSTLSDEHWRGGIAEAFKVAIIKDRNFFDFLARKAAVLNKRDQGAIEELTRRCAILHLDHIGSNGDPFEYGSARPLDFGHWSAHKLEALSGYRISHGAAVATGIALDSYYAMKKGLLTPAELSRILGGLTATGFKLWYPEMGSRRASGGLAILEGLEEFREHLGGKLTVTLPDSIGRKVEVDHLNPEFVEEGLFYLRSQAASSQAG